MISEPSLEINYGRDRSCETVGSSDENIISDLVDGVVVTAYLEDHIGGGDNEEAGKEEVKDQEESSVGPVED